MKVRHLFVGAAFCAATALWSSSVYSQTKDEKKPAAEKPAPTPPPAAKPAPTAPPTAAPKPGVTAAGDKPAAGATGGAEDPMMKMMMEMAAPGPEHEKLKPLAGSWTCTVKFWPAPGAPPEESTGTLERKWVLGGRFLQEDYRGTAMNMPFEGMGFVGYDKMQRKYDALWMDTMGTGVWSTSGSFDASGKTLTFSGENFDPMVGKKVMGRSTLEMVNNDKQVAKMFGPGPDGKEFQNLEMVMTRK